MVEVVRTNFAPIFSDFEKFSRVLIVVPLATIFKSDSSTERAFFPEKKLKTMCKSAYKHRRYLLLNNATV